MDTASSLFDVLEEHGYALVEPVLATEEVEALRACVDEIPPGERRGGLRDALSRVPALHRCAFDPRLLGLAESVLGAGARPVKGIVSLGTRIACGGVQLVWLRCLTIDIVGLDSP